MNLQRKKILSSLSAGDFIGRSREMDALLRHAKGDHISPGRVLLSAPLAGASELLRQIYDQLFFEQGETIPFYFALRASDGTAERAALRFLQSFLLQVVAFRRRDPKILDSSPDMDELAEIAVPADGYWIDRLIEAHGASKLNDERAFTIEALSAPLRAGGHGARVVVMVDDLHEAAQLAGEVDFLEELKAIYSRAGIPFIFSGNRRFLFREVECEAINLGPLSFSDSGLLAENLSAEYGVKINEQTRDLIATQLQGNPAFTRFLFQAANKRGKNLDSFQRVEQFYTDELMGGRISSVYDSVFTSVAANADLQKNILGLVYDTLTLDNEPVPVESWQNRTGLEDAEFYRLMDRLNSAEILRLSSGHVDTADENTVLADYITTRFRLEVVGENRALVVGESLSGFLKRAPRLMANFYRRNSAIGLRELMSAFDCQAIPPALIDYSRFRDEFKGAPDEEVLKAVAIGGDVVYLPQIIYTAHTAAVYRPLIQVTEKERAAVALGFQESKYTDEDEIVWIAAEIDSKLEAGKDLAEFWCDRLEMVALVCNFVNYKIWLIAPEGFSPEALDVLEQRNAYGSSRRQVDLLIKALNAESIVGEKLRPNEYEMIVPMGEDTELIAAHTVEEIAKRHHFLPKAINQIKTALVEACINASEHSHSPDRKIYQRFTVEDDRIVITISNRGLRLTDKKGVEVQAEEGRRGWGLKLMKSLMDEVKLEQVDDGTRISMTKYLKK